MKPLVSIQQWGLLIISSALCIRNILISTWLKSQSCLNNMLSSVLNFTLLAAVRDLLKRRSPPFKVTCISPQKSSLISSLVLLKSLSAHTQCWQQAGFLKSLLLFIIFFLNLLALLVSLMRPISSPLAFPQKQLPQLLDGSEPVECLHKLNPAGCVAHSRCPPPPRLPHTTPIP